MTTETLTLIERSMWTATAVMPLAAAFRALLLERRAAARRRKPALSMTPRTLARRPPVAPSRLASAGS